MRKGFFQLLGYNLLMIKYVYRLLKVQRKLMLFAGSWLIL